jgi:N-acetylglucosaminyl-diphospho-decaprenol L-rhamnosyltransferase
MPPVTVAVVSYNTRALLEACLASLEDDWRAGLCEVWVVDNGSTDGSASLVRSAFGWVRLVEASENLGFGAAVNLVASRTSTPFVVAANADVAVLGGALTELLRAAAADPGAGAFAPRLVLPDGSVQHSVFPFPTVLATAFVVLGLARRRLCVPGAWDPSAARRVPWAVGAFLLVRRSAWDEAGGFDERQWLYAEDLDLGWRLRRAGWATRYVPSAVVRHDESAATRVAFGDARVDRWQQATYAWVRRRLGSSTAIAVALLNVAGALARAALHPRRASSYLRWARRHARCGLLPRRHR